MRHHDPTEQAHTHRALTLAWEQRGDDRQALEHAHHALTLNRSLGHAYQVANTLDSLGHPHAALGRHEQARTVWREALELYRDRATRGRAPRVNSQIGGRLMPEA